MLQEFAEMFGKVPDAEIAELAGVPVEAVVKAREDAKIPAFVPEPAKPLTAAQKKAAEKQAKADAAKKLLEAKATSKAADKPAAEAPTSGTGSKAEPPAVPMLSVTLPDGSVHEVPAAVVEHIARTAAKATEAALKVSAKKASGSSGVPRVIELLESVPVVQGTTKGGRKLTTTQPASIYRGEMAAKVWSMVANKSLIRIIEE